MNQFIAIAIAASVAAGGATGASARDGCGRGFHRGPAGYCRPNAGGPVVVVRPRIGVFYPGRGYWDGRRYYQHRYWHHRGWRYR